ncbi:MAG: DUF3012 domain-containing protein [Pseudomonadota bacterium]|jgi:outer membrane murein-binding lipoprotein Lpp|nr:DUF3012 domain-containing protein [Pseudomonadota bacterium]
MKNKLVLGTVFLAALLLAGCEPEIGSEEWCASMKERNAEDITAKEAADFTKHCVF